MSRFISTYFFCFYDVVKPIQVNFIELFGGLALSSKMVGLFFYKIDCQ
jgi:hypothetical protein